VFVPRLTRAGADVVIVSCHSGATTSSSYGDALPYPENASTLLAQQVPDIDAILVDTPTWRSPSGSSPTRGPVGRRCCPSR
jgi:hypothetical protein